MVVALANSNGIHGYIREQLRRVQVSYQGSAPDYVRSHLRLWRLGHRGRQSQTASQHRMGGSTDKGRCPTVAGKRSKNIAHGISTESVSEPAKSKATASA